MKLLLLGNTGQLGWELDRVLRPYGEVVGLDFPGFDMANADSIRTTIREHRPEIIINAAAYTAVDQAEREPESAAAINAIGPAILAEEAKSLHAIVIHYSTDFVFDGMKGSPYAESDIPNPVNEYGQSKWDGERAIQSMGGAYLIFRTAWVYSLRRDCFVTKVLQWARQKETLRIVEDQISNPTWARMLAEITGSILGRGPDYLRERQGLYHLAGDGFTSRWGWAMAILEFDPRRSEQVVQQILPARTSEFPDPARRPAFSALDCSQFRSAFGLVLPGWKDSLQLAMTP
jgi:dTDP-4-dehydrorhamnose reductase